MSNIFTIIENSDDTVTVFLGDPAILGAEAEFIMTIHKSLVAQLVATLSK